MTTHREMIEPTEPTDAQIEEITWRWFAEAHPHEAYSSQADRFWKFFLECRPGITREEMERLLRETE
jgi:hypothetical protein